MGAQMQNSSAPVYPMAPVYNTQGQPVVTIANGMPAHMVAVNQQTMAATAGHGGQQQMGIMAHPHQVKDN